MKKFLYIVLAICLLCTMVVLPSCGESDDTSKSESKPEPSNDDKSGDNTESSAEESAEVKITEDAVKLWNSSYASETIKNTDDLKKVIYYYNSEITEDYTKKTSSGDAKIIFSGDSETVFVNPADGYKLTLPSNSVTGDFSLGEYRSKLFFNESVLTVSKEDQNPYGNTENGWNIYLTEWITMRFTDSSFLSANNIMNTRKTVVSTEILDGYEVRIYYLYNKLPKEMEYPHYNIAIIRPVDDYINFYLLVMKSTEKMNDEFDKIVSTFSETEKSGNAANHVGQYELIIPEYWSDETKAYYNKLLNNNVPDWGFYYKQNDADVIEWMASEDGIDYDCEIFMTYLHLGWYSEKLNLDLDMVNKNAGGNGFNGKPVLNLTYQFTTTNNMISGYTPMFDILRGKFDDHFRKLAQDIKAYGKPVIFRLNNEMNTDWTSYSGIVTLLDPDMFIEAWKRMYNIFREEGVDNTIWVINPFDPSIPYSSWGEWINYFPGPEYCQMIGLTSYEEGNGTSLKSFKSRYQSIYDRYSPYFDSYPWMIGEFACGAGGEKYYEWTTDSYIDKTVARNESIQAAWVREMFKCFTHSTEEGYEFANKIKVAVWFSASDYVTIDGTNYIKNYYELDSRLQKTLAVFREWLPKMHAND